MIRIWETFHIHNDALRFAENYLDRYSPYGYDTTLTITRSDKTGDWIVSGTRAKSCD